MPLKGLQIWIYQEEDILFMVLDKKSELQRLIQLLQ